MSVWKRLGSWDDRYCEAPPEPLNLKLQPQESFPVHY